MDLQSGYGAAAFTAGRREHLRGSAAPDGRATATATVILDTSSERCLYFTQANLQSVMSLDEPDALIAAYTRKMMAFLLFNPAPKRITMIGLGGGSLAKFCYRNLPRSSDHRSGNRSASGRSAR